LPQSRGERSSHRVAVSGDVEVSAYLEIAEERLGEQPQVEPAESPPEKREAVVIVDFGSQYSWLIARRVRECNVYCEVVAHDASWESIAHLEPKGFLLSGGPGSVYDEDAPMAPAYVYESHVPVLGICYGMQLIAHQLGSTVLPGQKREYGLAVLHQSAEGTPLFDGIPPEIPVWMSHGDRIDD
jgi:GMP synthase (glutamine-hydrolysing)